VSDTKTRSDGSVDSLTKSASIAFSESELAKVSGGETVNKAKTADKAYQQRDGYIKQ
jgi:hypothetical protein